MNTGRLYVSHASSTKGTIDMAYDERLNVKYIEELKTLPGNTHRGLQMGRGSRPHDDQASKSRR